ncbi:MAG: hypothetical protein U9Q83_11715 [Bacteroidota bacterium]|nr:hypothetical protein [Bacteroidota bacterium]
MGRFIFGSLYGLVTVLLLLTVGNSSLQGTYVSFLMVAAATIVSGWMATGTPKDGMEKFARFFMMSILPIFIFIGYSNNKFTKESINKHLTHNFGVKKNFFYVPTKEELNKKKIQEVKESQRKYQDELRQRNKKIEEARESQRRYQDELREKQREKRLKIQKEKRERKAQELRRIQKEKSAREKQIREQNSLEGFKNKMEIEFDGL